MKSRLRSSSPLFFVIVAAVWLIAAYTSVPALAQSSSAPDAPGTTADTGAYRYVDTVIGYSVSGSRIKGPCYSTIDAPHSCDIPSMTRHAISVLARHRYAITFASIDAGVIYATYLDSREMYGYLSVVIAADSLHVLGWSHWSPYERAPDKGYEFFVVGPRLFVPLARDLVAGCPRSGRRETGAASGNR